MQRLSSWLIGVLALAVFAAAGYVVTKKDPVPDAGQVLPVTGVSNQPSSSATSATASSSTTSTAGRTVAFLGDDWTVGVGASKDTDRFTSRLAATLGVTEKNFGATGTGYAKSSASDGTYASRVAAVVAAQPDVVVVAGGRNDTNDYVPTMRKRVRALFAELRAKLPQATIVAVAPMWGDSDAPTDLAPVTAAVKQYVTASDGTYLDLADPVRGHPGYMRTDADPNDKGYAAIASALAPELRPLLT